MIALYGKKVGMTQIFDSQGFLIPVSVIYIEPNVIIGSCQEDKHGYNSKLLGAFKTNTKHVTKSHLGMFKSDNLRKKIFEVKGYKDAEIGNEIGVEVFENINFVDVTGTSKGKGFQGVMKRHGYHGGPAAHGSKFHRSGGSTGHAATPSRVRKGTKMAGRMGSDTITTQNLQIMSLDKEKNVLLVKGAVPGVNGGSVLIKAAIKKGIGYVS